MRKYSALGVVALMFSGQLEAMGLRSFVALPVAKNSSVLRFLYSGSLDGGSETLFTSAAYGISGKQTLLLGVPYQLSNNTANKFGDVTVFLRQSLWQQNSADSSNRLALLAGLVLPTNSNRDVGAQAGFVYTHFKNRHEIDTDIIYQKGLGQRLDSARFDFSWQYRINPKILPDWGIGDEIYTVLEFNQRWQQGNKSLKQITAGLTWVKPRWVIEGGLTRDLNQLAQTQLIISTRIHF